MSVDPRATPSNLQLAISTPAVEEGYKFLRVDLFWIQVMFFIFAIFLFAVCMYACLFVRWVYKRRLNQKIEDMINRYYRDDENRKRAQIEMQREEVGAGEFKKDCICRKNQHICQIPKIITDGKSNDDSKGSKEGVKVVRIDEQKGSDMKQPSAKLQKVQSKNTLSFHDIVKAMQSDPDLVKTMPVLKQAVQDVACQTIDDSLFPPQPPSNLPPIAPIIAPPGGLKKQSSKSDLFEDYGSMSYYENNGKVSGVMNSSQMSEPPTAPTTVTTTTAATSQPTTAASSSDVTTSPSTSTPTTKTPPIAVTKKPSTPKPLKKKKKSVAKSQDTPTASEEDKESDSMVSMKEPKKKDLGGKSSSVASVFFPINNTSSPFAENSTRLFPFFNKANPKPPTTTSSKKSTDGKSSDNDNISSKYL